VSQTSLYPLRFEPIYQYRLWGGRRLASLLTAPLPGSGPIGEAWVLSDREDHPSRVADGSLKGRTIGQVLEQFPEQIMGRLAGRFRRFPLLLKFLDVREMLSVQVHPTDPATAKTEAWVVLEAGIKSRIYAGLKAGATEMALRNALRDGTVADDMACFHPKPGDAVFLPARWVMASSYSRFNRTATRRFACSTGIMSIRRRASRERSKWIRRWLALISESVPEVW